MTFPSLSLFRRLWRRGDGTRFIYRYVHRPGWWTLYLGYVGVEYYQPKQEREQ